VDIQPPDLETRVAILRKKAVAVGVDLPTDVTVYIAERVHSNIRELEGVLIRLKAYSVVRKEPMNLQFARSVLDQLLLDEIPQTVDIEDIMECVCNYFELKRSDLIGASRLKKFATPRHIAMYLTRNLTPLSYPEIAAKFGGRDHTSVLHAVKKITEDMEHDQHMKNLLGHLTKRLRSQRSPVSL
jgi:chromosomal replication initiator protein